jgi:hypothetical protein
MAVGKPIAAFDLAETRNAAQNAAVYVRPGDIEGFGCAIVALLGDHERRKQMGDYGQQRVVSQMSWERQYPKLSRAYEVVLRKKNNSPAEPLRCQLSEVPNISEGKIKFPHPFLFRLRLLLKRHMSISQRKQLMKSYRLLLHPLSREKDRPAPPQPQERKAPARSFQPGDLVRVRSREEIMGTLDPERRLKGCSFMPEMEPYLGTTQRVLKRVERFLDERDYNVKRTSGIILLEGVMCQGTIEFGPCDRSCFFFWRQEWLELIQEAQPTDPPAE